MPTAQISTTAVERLRSLSALLADQDGFRTAVEALRGKARVSFEGVIGSSRSLLAAALRQVTPGLLVVVCAYGRQIDEIAEELQLFADVDVATFPPWETAPDERDVADDIFGERLRALKQLHDRGARPRVLVTCIQSLQQPVPAPRVLADQTRRIRLGDTLPVDELLGWLASHGYHATSAVDLPGEYARRGGILDVFAADWSEPVRIELFDDQVESLRIFDAATQRSLKTVNEIEITVLVPCLTAEHSFADYLPPDSLVLLVEPDEMRGAAEDYLQRLDRDGRIFTMPEVLQALQHVGLAAGSAVAGSGWETSCRLALEGVEHFSGEVGRVRGELDRVSGDHTVIIVVPTDAETQRLSELLAAGETAAQGRLFFAVGGLYGGFRLIPEKTLVLSGNDLFQRTMVHRVVRRRHAGRPLDSFLDLREGDLVVHLAHGIGRYRGLKLLQREGQAEEHLTIEFDAGVKVYVPATRIHLVQKYIGGAKTRPSLARIGGKSWVRQRQAAEKAVLDVAADMLSLQAQRAARAGIAFAPDSEWQKELDASFPYTETPDQLAAIRAIKSDMEVARPMDRLLCGDVGFGKTELAMRAAFKAAESGYQVAVLVPTTVLAEQHYRTFCERMAEFPLDIAKLSRFCTSAEQKQVIDGLASGRIDIVIGTHRLASKDVCFENLGMVIIDEEQRFGVDVKERLKRLRSTVDVLTMTATPIPRTLHMALVGVRDISNLETPPEDRMAVETKVTRWSNELIRHAVLRELSRGGQIYFVHNRVQDIDLVAARLRQIVPEARLQIAHGQMNEHDLEQRMVDFVAHRFDLLLATTIVESGLDIPNANTIFIDEADRYGLADLHQLRGRVGRYKHRAYCYLLLDPNKSLTPSATRRLLAIEEFSEMGAGFAIAMRDLEIRGAGNLLGTEQSGHIAAIGYELYCQLLENAVRSLRQLPPKKSLDVEINLPLQAYLPEHYVDDIRQRIDFYRRLNRAADYDQLQEFRGELLDRFGPLPAAAEGLFTLAELRIDAAVWQLQAIYVEDDFLVLRYADRSRMTTLARGNPHVLRFVDDQRVYIPMPPGERSGENLLCLAKSVLRRS
jgi:transcription-repair coupling factor (superfamily II helicase)